jgi:uncharacterized protein YegP (UPF0339 family)
MVDETTPRPGKVETFEKRGRSDRGGRRYYFRALGGNGEQVASSEAYNSVQARDEGIAAAARAFASGVIEPE